MNEPKASGRKRHSKTSCSYSPYKRILISNNAAFLLTMLGLAVIRRTNCIYDTHAFELSNVISPTRLSGVPSFSMMTNRFNILDNLDRQCKDGRRQRRRQFALFATYDDDEDDDDDDDYYDNEPISPASLNSLQSSFSKTQTPPSFGYNRGKSAPEIRKGIGLSSNSAASVYVCTNCGAEYIKWIGKCSTCSSWNTVQEFKAPRQKGGGGGGGRARPVFQSRQDFGSGGSKKPSSWLTGIDSGGGAGAGGGLDGMDGPVSITSVYKDMGYYEKADDNPNDTSSSSEGTFSQYRLVIPNDDEVNNVLGGGLMPGSLTLLGGDPGVGKSTLLMQLAGEVASLSTPPRGIGMGKDENAEANGHGPVWYVSGEENAIQIASRAHRLGIEESELLLLCETDADRIAELVVTYAHDAMATMDNNNNLSNDGNNDGEPPLGRRKQPSLLIIDSIQTMLCDNGASSSAGSIRQVRECVHLFLRLAKSTHVPIVLVGHVTKSGDVAGPRTVEHMVDAVLYLEGSGSGGSGGSANHWNLRMLRAVKNRFGSASEVGMYEMSSRAGGRLVPVSDPSSFFLAHRGGEGDVEGCAISLVLEGIRPMTVEVQALVSSASGPSFVGRRNVNGISNARLVLILAVLQKRCRVGFWGKMDVYVNVVGGVRLMGNSGRGRGGDEGSESDLAIAVAVVSSFLGIEVRADTAFVGEIGLLGELRAVSSAEKRINEARRMGFSRIVIPKQNMNYSPQKKAKWGKSYQKSQSAFGIECVECETLREAINAGLVSPIPKKIKRKSKKFVKGMFKGGKISGKSNSSKIDLGLDDEDEFIIDDSEDYDDEDEFSFQ